MGVKGRKEPKRARVKGLEVEAESGSGKSKFKGFDMGSWVTQDLSVVLLGIQQEMAEQSKIMWQMLQVFMAQLEVMRVSGIDLASQAEAVCHIRSG